MTGKSKTVADISTDKTHHNNNQLYLLPITDLFSVGARFVYECLGDRHKQNMEIKLLVR